jgi:hypothetical protein
VVSSGVPSPMPVVMRDGVNSDLASDALEPLDSNGRFVVRRMVADAYARGFADGRLDESQSAAVERMIERNKETSHE